jgi:hypothetical protein
MYITGSTALEPLLKSLGPTVAKQATNPYTLVYYKKDGSCGGYQRILTTPAGPTIAVSMLFLPASGFCDTAQTMKAPCTCTIDTAAPQTVDLVLSDVDPTLCPTTTPPHSAIPSGWVDFQGPVNDMTIVAPMTSTIKSVSAEMLYLIFGKGAAGMVTPYVDPLYYFIRTGDSGTRAMINANIKVADNPWLGCAYTDCPTNAMAANGSGDVFNKVSAQNNSPNADKTLGILGEDFLDTGTNRTTVKPLAFRAFNQQYAYWPDSSQNAHDRKNVRDGHYKIWGYIHMLAPVTGGTAASNISDAKAQFFVNLLQGNPPAGFTFPTGAADIDDVVTDTHLTPRCAMAVDHDSEGKDQKPLANAPPPCGCSFEARATGATPTGCTACTGAGQGTCTSGMCRKGFCEAK